MARPQLVLAIEASNPLSTPQASSAVSRASSGERCSVALGEVQDMSARSVRLLVAEPIRSGGRHDDDLMPAIDRVFRAARARPTDLAQVAISVGPGGFTGLRIAVAAAQCIAETVGARCIAVPTSDALIRRVPSELRAARMCSVLLAWKRSDVWCARYPPGDPDRPCEESGLVPLASLRGSSSIIVADTELQALLAQDVDARVMIDPCFDAAAVLEASIHHPLTDPAELRPLYPREPEAVSKWRELHPGAQPSTPRGT